MPRGSKYDHVPFFLISKKIRMISFSHKKVTATIPIISAQLLVARALTPILLHHVCKQVCCVQQDLIPLGERQCFGESVPQGVLQMYSPSHRILPLVWSLICFIHSALTLHSFRTCFFHISFLVHISSPCLSLVCLSLCFIHIYTCFFHISILTLLFPL